MKAPPKTLGGRPPPLPRLLSPISLPFFLVALFSVSAHAFVILALVVEVFSEDSLNIQDIIGMTIGKSYSQIDQTPRPRKKRSVAWKELSEARAQAPASDESLPSPSNWQVNDLERYHLLEKLVTLPRSTLKFCFFVTDSEKQH